jgi:hypothetical protein
VSLCVFPGMKTICAMAQRVSRRPGFDPRSGHVGFVVVKVALGQVLSEYFGFSCHFLFHRLLHTHHLPTRAGAIGQLVANVPSGLSLTPPQEIKKKDCVYLCKTYENI